MSRKSVFIYLIAGTLLFIGIIISSIVYTITPRSTVIMSVAPNEVNLSIDDGANQSIKNGQTINFSPGDHKLVFSRDEFDSYSQNISVENKETISVFIALTPKTDAASQLLTNQESASVIETIYEMNMNKSIEETKNKYPELSVFPIDRRLYTVSICDAHDPSKPVLCAHIEPNTYKNNKKDIIKIIIKDIESYGFDASEYTISYKPLK